MLRSTRRLRLRDAAPTSSRLSIRTRHLLASRLVQTRREPRKRLGGPRLNLIETASPGYHHVALRGAEADNGRLHPESPSARTSIRERATPGFPSRSVLQPYRPPAFGSRRFSLRQVRFAPHPYGLAVDVRGIGGPGSPEAAGCGTGSRQDGVVCPYGPRDPAESKSLPAGQRQNRLARNGWRAVTSAARWTWRLFKAGML